MEESNIIGTHKLLKNKKKSKEINFLPTNKLAMTKQGFFLFKMKINLTAVKQTCWSKL